MKKLFALVLVICLAFAGIAGYWGGISYRIPTVPAAPQSSSPEAPAAAGAEEEAGGEAAGGAGEAGASAGPDLDALYALHAPEEIVALVNGTEISWAKYFYILRSQISGISNYFDAMSAYYGMTLGWNDEYTDDVTFAQMAVDSTETSLTQICAIEDYAKENGAALTEEDEAGWAEELSQDMVNACGEGATEADFDAYLAGLYMDRDLLRWMYDVNSYYQRNYLQLYGDAGSLYDGAAALSWMENNGYLSASHILFMTVDSSTQESLSEEEIQSKRDQAQAVVEELRAIEDSGALVARFRELKDELCEDTGKAVYPDGYTFTPGTMVTEFEDAVTALEDYQVSDVVESSYGFHVIMRLPLDPDAVIQYSGDGVSPVTAKSLASQEEYEARLSERMAALPVEYAPGFEPEHLTAYFA